ncbi:S41 family peptidase [Dyadobacter sp.]|uniref:S41 family peptidase n=1 Tax=Dyadobacter sp. TaxID=1914288 RepID=UPI003F711878
MLYILLPALLAAGCKGKEVAPDIETAADSTAGTDYVAVNNWLYEIMDDAYFWYKEMPAKANLDASTDPYKYFEKLVYQRATVDRFSGVTNDIASLQNEFNGISKIFGISYSLSYIDNGNSNIGVFLNYVVKGSPAAAAGLKRGDILLKVNGTQLTASNYATLLNGETITLTLGQLQGNSITATTNTVSITKAEVTEDPVAFSSIISKPAYGKTIGYLVYTQFVPGTAADEEKYDNELRQIFADFKSKGVNELVLDLRLNSGGYISSAKTLASLIGKNISASKVFYKEVWNDKYNTYWQRTKGADALNYKFQSEANNIGNNLNRVFVLTSNGTASASELVINGLEPYMEVITIGENTAGKNLFGSLINDDQKRWNWGVYLMLGQTVNANDKSDYGTVNGMTPDYLTEDSKVPYLAFGDENETLLRKAMDVMGIPASSNMRVGATKTVSSFRKSLRDDLQAPRNLMIRTEKPALLN